MKLNCWGRQTHFLNVMLVLKTTSLYKVCYNIIHWEIRSDLPEKYD